MRKLIFLLFFGVFTFTLPGSLHANVNGISLKEFPRQSLLYQRLNVNNIDLLEEIILLPEEAFDDIEAAKIITRIDQLPENMLRKLTENQIQMALFNGKLTDHPTAQSLAGISPRGYESNLTWDDVPGVGGSKLVLVKIGSSDKGNGHGSVNLELHELAHSMDRHVYHLIREDPAFLDIWRSEARDLFPGKNYFLKYPEEYFAETFAMYYLGGETKKLLKEVAPKTFKYIHSLQ